MATKRELLLGQWKFKIPHSFLQELLLCDFDPWLLNRGQPLKRWPLHGGSTNSHILHAPGMQNLKAACPTDMLELKFFFPEHCTSWKLYSWDTLQTKASVSRKEVSPEWRLGQGLLLINQQNRIFFISSALESTAIIISSSQKMY